MSEVIWCESHQNMSISKPSDCWIICGGDEIRIFDSNCLSAEHQAISPILYNDWYYLWKKILNALLYQCKSDKIWVEWLDQEKRVTENMINKCVLIKPKKDHLGTIGRLSVFVALQEPLIVKHVCINGLLWLCTVMKVKATF